MEPLLANCGLRNVKRRPLVLIIALLGRRTGVQRPDVVGGNLKEVLCNLEGYEVQDILGYRMGTVEKLFSNGDGEPRFVRVRFGFFGKSVLMPVRNIVVDGGRRTLKLGKATPR